MKKVFIVIISFSLFGCASYSKQGFKKNYIKLNKNNISELLTGKYELFPVKRSLRITNYPKEKLKPRDYVPSDNLYRRLSDEYIYGGVFLEENNYYIVLKLVDNTILKVDLVENDSIIKKSTSIKGKIKNSMFYFDNKKLSIKGVPFIYGSYSKSKKRIGILKNKNLLINEAIGHEGGILFFGIDRTYNFLIEFKRILE